MSETFSCISLWQPWASLIAVRAKPFETRHWRPSICQIGHRIAIHAAKRPPTSDDVVEMDRLVNPVLGPGWWRPGALPYGAVICTAVLDGVYQIKSYGDGVANLEVFGPIIDDGFGNYAVGRYCWHLIGIDVLPQPVSERGRQSFWQWRAS